MHVQALFLPLSLYITGTGTTFQLQVSIYGALPLFPTLTLYIRVQPLQAQARLLGIFCAGDLVFLCNSLPCISGCNLQLQFGVFLHSAYA